MKTRRVNGKKIEEKKRYLFENEESLDRHVVGGESTSLVRADHRRAALEEYKNNNVDI